MLKNWRFWARSRYHLMVLEQNDSKISDGLAIHWSEVTINDPIRTQRQKSSDTDHI